MFVKNSDFVNNICKRFQSLFDIIREAQKRREMKKAVEKFGEQRPLPKSEDIVANKPEDSSKRPDTH